MIKFADEKHLEGIRQKKKKLKYTDFFFLSRYNWFSHEVVHLPYLPLSLF